tara:strand:+ start:4852 stop:4971 length:120 start_codon:yes stop_codon:yes gene_type:complete
MPKITINMLMVITVVVQLLVVLMQVQLFGEQQLQKLVTL